MFLTLRSRVRKSLGTKLAWFGALPAELVGIMSGKPEGAETNVPEVSSPRMKKKYPRNIMSRIVTNIIMFLNLGTISIF